MNRWILALIIVSAITGLILAFPPKARALATYNVQANVFTDNPDGSNQVEVGGAAGDVSFKTPCVGSYPSSVITGASITSGQVTGGAPYNTDYWYANVPSGDEYCMAITGTEYAASPYIPGFDGPFQRPWNYSDGPGGDEDNYPNLITKITNSVQACTGTFTGSYGTGPFSTTNYQDHCPPSLSSSLPGGYLCQEAGGYHNPDQCGNNDEDRGTDAGIDFDYVSLREGCPTYTTTSPNCGASNANTYSPVCTITPSTTTPLPGQAFTVSYTIKNNAAETPLYFTTAATSNTVSFAGTSGTGLTLSGPPTSGSGTTITEGSTYSSGNFSSTGASTGTYTITMQVNADNVYGPPSTIELANCSKTITVAAVDDQPYFRVYGGDVMAGVESKDITACYDTDSGIYNWNSGGTGANNLGAGTTAADLASGPISQFVSGQDVLSLLTPPPLSFANTPTSTYGGSYGYSSGQGSCSGYDYYTWAQSVSSLSACPSTISGSWANTAGITGISESAGSISVSPGAYYVCEVSGSNVTIANNVIYNVPDNTAPNEYPTFEVIVKNGNIEIDTPYPHNPSCGSSVLTGVCQLYGTYIAEGSGNQQSSGATGIISDTDGGNTDQCASGVSDDGNNECAEDQLTVYGSFVANEIDLYRTYGTLNSTASCPTTVSLTNNADPCSAEEFNYYPFLWLQQGTPNLTVQSIVSLPPVL